MQGNKILEMLLKGRESKGVSGGEDSGFYQQTQTKLAYHSGNLDGIRLAESQVEFIHENGSVKLFGSEPVTLDDIQEVKNHFLCMDYLLDHVEEPLSEDLLKHCHKLLKEDTLTGGRTDTKAYKTKKNMAGNMPTTAPELVEEEIAVLLDNYESKEKKYIEDVFAFHCQLIGISPFTDGNGRIARMLLFKECLRHDITPFIIEDMQKVLYFKALRDGGKHFDMFADLCFQAQGKYKDLVQLFTKRNSR